MNNWYKYNCYLIDNITNQKYDSSPVGGYNAWTSQMFVAISARDSHSFYPATVRKTYGHYGGRTHDIRVISTTL